MKIVVTGGAGFLGTRIINRLLSAKDSGAYQVDFDAIVSIDIAPCEVEDDRVTSIVGSVGDRELLYSQIDSDVVGIFHLAAVLSGGSEDDFDLAYAINVEATRSLLEAARNAGNVPKFVFTSSLAVFGGELPDVVTDMVAVQPESTYGAFKSIGEVLVNEYSRKGYVDGRICRVPTISVRPGVPNSAASSFASGIVREPLNGVPSTVPVPLETKMWLSSPNAAVANLVRMLEVEALMLPAWRVVNLPGITVTVDEMLRGLEQVGGKAARNLVETELDQRIIDIVGTWPAAFDTTVAKHLGCIKDSSFERIVQQYFDEFVAR